MEIMKQKPESWQTLTWLHKTQAHCIYNNEPSLDIFRNKTTPKLNIPEASVFGISCVFIQYI